MTQLEHRFNKLEVKFSKLLALTMALADAVEESVSEPSRRMAREVGSKLRELSWED